MARRRRRRRVASNPCVGVWHSHPPVARERVLSETEIRWLWLGCDQITIPYGALFRLLLLTGCRLNEVTAMRRAELSDDGATWTIPGERTKNHRTHVVPLAPLAREILASVPRIDSAAGFVFTVSGTQPVTSFSVTKAELDRAMLAAAREGPDAHPCSARSRQERPAKPRPWLSSWRQYPPQVDRGGRTNGMLQIDGVSRYSKWRALNELERRGMIVVERRRRSPLIQVLVEP